MRLDIRGKGGFVITDAIYNYLEKKLKKIDKVFQNEIEAYVVCKVYREGITKVEITIPVKFITMRAEVQDRDLYAAIDRAIDIYSDTATLSVSPVSGILNKSNSS